ncbi:MAG: 3-isopropylmalate dehydratase small subunit [Gemmatimonadetes bacterium]|nr:3-isopropylmalate dehydratase small subunit [Gemmatimonadota bacterium]
MSPRAPIGRFTSHWVLIPGNDIDTDQIIPARFLKTTERTGLGPHAFHDWRYQADGAQKVEFPLNQPGAAGAEILLAGHNFGCGSSREHAVWALQDAGFRAVISTRFADIFRANALANGLLPIQVEPGFHGVLVSAVPGTELTVDLANETIELADGRTTSFSLPPFSRYGLLKGVDELDFLAGAEPDIAAFESAHAARISTLAVSRSDA